MKLPDLPQKALLMTIRHFEEGVKRFSWLWEGEEVIRWEDGAPIRTEES
jgi:hypothetical protein